MNQAQIRRMTEQVSESLLVSRFAEFKVLVEQADQIPEVQPA
jgi:hypothetical protein